MKAFDQLIQIVRMLRAENGCPWDKEQTPQSLRPYLLEETYEVLDAIQNGGPENLSKELGDLLFQILLIAQMADEGGEFSIQDVIEQISNKMVRRHPHVFDEDYEPGSAEGSIDAWENRKAKERENNESILAGVPQTLPALLRAYRISEKASRVGFDWPDISGVRQKLDEEINEMDEAIANGVPAEIEHEYGDLLLTLVKLGRFLPATPEEALRGSLARFESRFQYVEQTLRDRGESFHETPIERLESIWEKAKEATCSYDS